MKVLLIKDVYKLGRAGEIKKVADGYGRNFLIPQKLAVPATDGSVKLAKTISEKATEKRAILNKELGSVAELLSKTIIEFSVKAGETGKLYGSVSNQMVADEIKLKHNIELDRHQIAMEPIRKLGEFSVPVHLTIDLIPELTVIVKREGEVTKILKSAEKELEPVVLADDQIEITSDNVDTSED